MRLQIKILLAFLIFFLCTSSAWAATYYIGQAGAGDDDGTSCANCDSITEYNAGGAPYDDLEGDTVYLCGEITTKIVPPNGGTSGSLHVIRGDSTPAGTVAVAGDEGIDVQVDYVHVTEITSIAATSGENFGLRFYDQIGGKVTNCTFPSTNSWTGVAFSNAVTTLISNGDFEAPSLAGSLDDDTNDDFDNWTESGVNGSFCEGTADANGGSQALELDYDGTPAAPYAVQSFATTEDYYYLIMVQHKSDGTCVGAIRMHDSIAGWDTQQLFSHTAASYATLGYIYQAGAGTTNLYLQPGGTGQSKYDDVEVYRITVNGEVSGCTFDGCGNDGIYLYHVADVDIYNNTFTDGGTAGSGDREPIGLYRTANIDVYKNYVSGWYNGFEVASGGDVRSTQGTFRHNWIKGITTGWGIYQNNASDVTMRSNVIAGTGTYGIWINTFTSSPTDANIHNNTIYNAGSDSIRISDGAGAAHTDSDILVKNNLSLSPNSLHLFAHADVTSEVTIDYNGYYPAGNDLWTWGADTDNDTLAEWQAACSQEANSPAIPSASPVYDAANDDFVLNVNSGFVSGGVDLGDSYDDLLAPRSDVDDPTEYYTVDADDIIPGTAGTGWPIGAYAPADYLYTAAGAVETTVFRHDGAEGDDDWFVYGDAQVFKHCLVQGRIYLEGNGTHYNTYAEVAVLDDQAGDTIVLNNWGFPEASGTVEGRETGAGTTTYTSCVYSASHAANFVDWDGDDFRLIRLSPLRGAGSAASGVTTGFRGRTIPDGIYYDIGAYQSILINQPGRPWASGASRFPRIVYLP